LATGLNPSTKPIAEGNDDLPPRIAFTMANGDETA
jgi:hypothetical protein